MRVKLFLTSDYEIWGDGRGSVPKSVIEPTNRMMEICKPFGAKLTFFFDVCEYWAMSKISEDSEFGYYREWSSLMLTQLRGALKDGHDVQLHFHPQWLDARLNEKGVWRLNDHLWRLPLIENHGYFINDLFRRGKDALEELFKEDHPDYSVQAFRAGAWCIQPEENVIKALKMNNIKVDSTAAYGMHKNDGRTLFDFRNVPNKPKWNVGSSLIDERHASELIELPIATSKIPFPSLIFARLPKLFRLNEIYPEQLKEKKDNEDSKRLFTKIFKSPIFQSRSAMLNFSDGSSCREMKYITKDWLRRHSKSGENPIPMVAISHPKTFGVANSLEEYLEWITDRYNVEFCTMRDYVKNRDEISG